MTPRGRKKKKKVNLETRRRQWDSMNMSNKQNTKRPGSNKK